MVGLAAEYSNNHTVTVWLGLGLERRCRLNLFGRLLSHKGHLSFSFEACDFHPIVKKLKYIINYNEYTTEF